MADGIIPNTPIEPGHRYKPRQSTPRHFDVSGVARGAIRHAQADSAPVRLQSVDTSQKGTEDNPASVVHGTQQSKTSSGVSLDGVQRVSRPSVQSAIPEKPKRTESAVKPAIPRQRRSLVLRRQMVAQATSHKKAVKTQKKRLVWAFSLGGAVASFVVVAGLFVYSRFEQPQVLSAESEQVTAAQTGAPLETPLAYDDIEKHTTPAEQPRLLSIAALGVQARVFPVKADYGDEPLLAPTIYDVGWLVSGSAPGEPGAALINGSVSGVRKEGVFRSLRDIKEGDKIIIEMGDGAVYSYRVVESRTYAADAVDMDSARAPIDATRPGLNLLTDRGRFNVRTNSFEDRRIVFATLD